MTASVNRVVLLGRLNKRGVEVRYANGGTPCASFTIDLTETSTTGQECTRMSIANAGARRPRHPAGSRQEPWCYSRESSSARSRASVGRRLSRDLS
jgi:hypothetical protein